MEFDGARPGIPAAIRDPGVVAIGRRLDADSVATIADGLVAGGVRAFELTLNEPVAGALASIEALAHPFADRTCWSARERSCPSRRPSVRSMPVPASSSRPISIRPRALGRDQGSALLSRGTDADRDRGGVARRGCGREAFPASVAGPALVRELRGPLPDIPLLPTGGVTLESAPLFIRAGAAGVGMGGWLTGDGDPSGIQQRAASIVVQQSRLLAVLGRDTSGGAVRPTGTGVRMTVEVLTLASVSWRSSVSRWAPCRKRPASADT